jgi:hypothetical protein
MDKRRGGKHTAHKRALVIAREHQSFFDRTTGGRNTLANLERLVKGEASRLTDHEFCRMGRRAATARCNHARRNVHNGVRHVATVSATLSEPLIFSLPRLTTDDERMARADAVLADVAPHAAAMEMHGIQDGFLDDLAEEVATFRAAKNAITLAGAQYTEATAAMDRTLNDADTAIAILEGILLTSADAPVGALNALRMAKRIGPRVRHVEQAAEAEQPPAALPSSVAELEQTEAGTRLLQWLPRAVVPLALAAAPAIPQREDEAMRDVG